MEVDARPDNGVLTPDVYSGVDLSKGVSQVKPLNCFRRLEKLVLPSIFDTCKSFIVHDVKLAELSDNSFN